jgi:hypothetical protein
LKFVILPLAWIQHIDLALKTAFHSRAFSLDLLLVLGNLGFVVFIRRGWAFSVALFLFLIYTGTRSFGGCVYTGFHSAPYFIVSLASLGWLIAFFCEPRRARILVTACLLVLFLKCTIPVYLRVTWPVYKRCLYSNQNLDAVFSTPYDRELKALTRPGDMIWSAGVNAYVYINNRCRPAGRVWGLVPWFADSYMDKIIADLERYKPKVIIFPSDGMVWGQALKDFGADIQRYIQPRYHPLDANVPVKKDIYILNNLPPSMP